MCFNLNWMDLFLYLLAILDFPCLVDFLFPFLSPLTPTRFPVVAFMSINIPEDLEVVVVVLLELFEHSTAHPQTQLKTNLIIFLITKAVSLFLHTSFPTIRKLMLIDVASRRWERAKIKMKMCNAVAMRSPRRRKSETEE